MEKEVVNALSAVINLNPKAKLVLVGHSAGGQLCSSLLHSPSLPVDIANHLTGMIMISGVYDLRPLVPTYLNEALKMDMYVTMITKFADLFNYNFSHLA